MTLCDQWMPACFSMISTLFPKPNVLSAAMSMKIMRIDADVGNIVELTDSQTRKNMMQLSMIAIRSLSIFSHVMNLDAIRGTPMISITVIMTLFMSTTSPNNAHIMNGIHNNDTM